MDIRECLRCGFQIDVEELRQRFSAGLGKCPGCNILEINIRWAESSPGRTYIYTLDGDFQPVSGKLLIVKKVLKEWMPRPYRMVSALGEQRAITKWESVVLPDGVTYWFWPKDHREPAAHIHMGQIDYPGRGRSDGYGGSVMKFDTVNHGIVSIQGPWHGNADSMFHNTGIDLRDKNSIFGVIGLRSKYVKGRIDAIIKDVIHIDPEEGVVGNFNRIYDLAKRYATQMQVPVFYASHSSSGSGSGSQYPTDWTPQQIDEYYRPHKEGLVQKAEDY